MQIWESTRLYPLERGCLNCFGQGSIKESCWTEKAMIEGGGGGHQTLIILATNITVIEYTAGISGSGSLFLGLDVLSYFETIASYLGIGILI